MNINFGHNQVTSTQKLRQEIVVKLNDGTVILGRIFLGFNERILDMLNEKRSFIAVELNTNQIILVAVNSIMCVDMFQATGGNSTKFDKKVEESWIYQNKNNIQEKINTKTQKDNPENYKKIYQCYSDIIDILDSSVFKEKITTDTVFENQVIQIIDLLRQASYIIEKDNT